MQHEFYFDGNNKLVLIIDGGAYGSISREQLHRKYPSLREVRRASGCYCEEAEIERCTVLVAVISSGTDLVDSIGYAFVCPIK
jgi:hypothetical protein